MKYRFGGKEKQLSFGRYPYITLAEALVMMQQALSGLSRDLDPAAAKKVTKATNWVPKSSFPDVAAEWIGGLKTFAKSTLTKKGGC